VKSSGRSDPKGARKDKPKQRPRGKNPQGGTVRIHERANEISPEAAGTVEYFMNKTSEKGKRKTRKEPRGHPALI